MIDKRLQVLRLLADRGTVTATAAALHFTPSAVSAQLRSLSEELGVDLLVPDGRRVRLTPAARVLVTQADDLYECWESIRAGVLAAADVHAGTFRLCGFSTAAAALLPALAVVLTVSRPQLDVRIIEAEPQECFEMLLADEADLAVVVASHELPPSSDRRFDLSPLMDDPLDLLLPDGHRLAGRSSIGFDEVSDEDWVGGRVGGIYHQLLMTACLTAGFVPNIAHLAAEWDTAASIVGAGMGIGLLPRLARIPTGYGVTRVPLRGDPRPSRRIFTGLRRGSRDSPVVAEALVALEEIAQGLSWRVAPV